MAETKGFPYKGQVVFPQAEMQESGKYAACFTIRSGKDGAGEVRYRRTLPTSEFDSADDALSYILDFAGDWIDHNPV